MSNLEAKFEALEAQLAAQAVLVNNSLDAIIEALGGVPPTPTTTLADVYSLLTTINSNISAAKSADSTFYAAMIDIASLIMGNTETMINNNSLNTQRLLAAILSTACPCTTTAPPLPPPLSVTPTPLVNDAKCRRIQFYLSVFSTWLFDIANYGSTGAMVTGGILFELLSSAELAAGLVIAGGEAGTIGGIPGAVVGAIIGLIVAAIYTFGGTQLVNWANDFTGAPVQSALLAALYAASNADEGQTAFQGVVSANFSAIPAGIINALWWSAWSNDLYSDTPVVNDSAFDGTICAPAETCTWITTGNRASVNIFFDRTGPWDDIGSGEQCDVTITLLSGSVDCRMLRDGTVLADWTPAPAHFEFSGAGNYQVLLAGSGTVSELFRVCQTGL